MSRLAYLAVLLVVLGSVGFGLDWQSATLSPMPDPKFALPSPAVVPPNKTDGPNATLTPASPGPLAMPNQIVGNGFARPLAQAAGPLASAVAPPNCNVSACAAAYRSFLVADCSYQPLNGPRRRCAKR